MKIKKNFIKLMSFCIFLCIIFLSACSSKKDINNESEETSLSVETSEIREENSEDEDIKEDQNEGKAPRIYISSHEKVKRGSTASIEICIEENFGVLGLLLSVQYDESVMMLTETKSGKAFESLHYTPSGELRSGSNFLWDGIKLDDIDIRNGEILCLTFHISEDAPKGTYDILLEVKENEVYDRTLTKHSLTAESGKITVE
jgi:hypothetical protein